MLAMNALSLSSMNPRIQELVSLIESADHAYYNGELISLCEEGARGISAVEDAVHRRRACGC